MAKKAKKKTIAKSSGRRIKTDEVNSDTLKSQIVEIALKHFAQFGFNGASLKDIAKEAKIASSLINYHFKDKSGLFSECLEPFARQRMETVLRVLGEPRTQEDLKVRLEIFIDDMIGTMLSQTHIMEIMDREIRANNPVVFKIFETTILHTFRAVVTFFEKAKVNKLIRSDKDPMICASILFSNCESAKKQVIAKRFFNVSFADPVYRKNYIHHVVDIFLNGVSR